MRITSVNIPKEKFDLGLQDIKLERLNRVVVLAGKNGAGKTRVFESIKKGLQIKPQYSSVQIAKKRHNELGYEINSLERDTRKINIPIRVRANDELDRKKTVYESYKKQLIDDSFVTTDVGRDKYISVDFVPVGFDLADPFQITEAQKLGRAKAIESVGILGINMYTYSKIQVTQDVQRNTSHPDDENDIADEERLKARNDYDKLKKYIKTFLGTELRRNKFGQATLFGQPLGNIPLSQGQKILLQFCMAIYSQEALLEEIILFLDEPENHLHPSILIDTIDKIISCTPNGQIWISTHSVPLLAYLSHLDEVSIHYVEDGKVEFGGKTPERVLRGLLGDDEQIGKLQSFLGLPAQMATNKFAFECLLPPGVVMTGSEDPQSAQLREALFKLVGEDEKLNILEFGAGQGRLISNIVDIDNSKQEDLVNKLNYVAYDKFTDCEPQCRASIEKAYGSSDKRYFSKPKDLINEYGEESFNVVIMCNVLHEIPPTEWIKLFKKNGEISRLLKPEGKLLLIEDNRLPVGEKAHKHGFLILDRWQLSKLFDIPNGTNDFVTDSRRGGRLNAHLIPKKYLEQITSETRKEAIESLAQMAKEQIESIREEEANYKNGELHGFWVQQFANAQLCLSEL